MELNSEVFRHGRALWPQHPANHQSLMMAFIINDGPTLHKPLSAHAVMVPNNQMAVAGEVSGADWTWKYHGSAMKQQLC